MKKIKFIDLFCGIGGFHYAFEDAANRLGFETECVFASDIDKDASAAYQTNFGFNPHSDITQVDSKDIPNHDILLAGFPCQAFSIIGARKGFDDTRGTLFFDIARILKEKQPKGFVLENVKQLKGHDNGRTLNVIVDTLRELGYAVEYKVLNAKDFGLPQKRERIFIVGWKKQLKFDWQFDEVAMKPLSNILEADVDKFYFASQKIVDSRKLNVKIEQIKHKRPTIWHENKSGNISAYEYSCALRAGASYNYLLVNGERRLTEREMLRLQGFPEKFEITHTYATMRRFAGNSLPIPAANAVIFKLIDKNVKKTNELKSTKAATSNKVSSTIPTKQLPKPIRKKIG
jgi:DNA (cytosine-5)-methyltransferase 1